MCAFLLLRLQNIRKYVFDQPIPKNLDDEDDRKILTQKDSSASQEDALTSVIGEFGKYQKIWATLIGSTSITTGSLNKSVEFHGPEGHSYIVCNGMHLYPLFLDPQV